MNKERFYTENEILPKALTALEDHLGIGWKTTYTPYEKQWILGDNEIVVKQVDYTAGQVERYRAIAIVQREIREQHLIKILDKLRHDNNQKVIVVAQKIHPKVKIFLKERNIDYLDEAGNCRIQHGTFFLDIDGKKPSEYYRETPNRAFTKTGLKVIFHVIHNENLINANYREIAKTAGVALGTIKFIINGLMEEGFLQRNNNTGYKLTNIGELEDRWINAYGERLRPNLTIGKFRFLNPNDFINWREIPIHEETTWWGGEAAGALYTDFLKPGELTLYTTEKRNELIKNYKLIPDQEGNVIIFQKFWNLENKFGNKVPPFLAYADLVLERNNRCLEIALQIHEQFLEKNI